VHVHVIGDKPAELSNANRYALLGASGQEPITSSSSRASRPPTSGSATCRAYSQTRLRFDVVDAHHDALGNRRDALRVWSRPAQKDTMRTRLGVRGAAQHRRARVCPKAHLRGDSPRSGPESDVSDPLSSRPDYRRATGFTPRLRAEAPAVNSATVGGRPSSARNASQNSKRRAVDRCFAARAGTGWRCRGGESPYERDGLKTDR
jgi:hypothetical protein